MASEQQLLLDADSEQVRSYSVVESQVRKPSVDLRRVLVPCAAGLFLSAVDNAGISSSYTAIASDLGQLQNASWIATGYLLALTSAQPLYGKLSDIFGRKGCIVFAYALYACGSLCCALSRDMAQLVASRAVVGLAGGGMTTLISIIMTDVAPLRSRGTWQGVMNLIYSCGTTIGAPLGGALADGPGWRWTFTLQFCLALLAIGMAATLLRLPTKESDHTASKLKRVDFFGSLFLLLAISTLLFGLNRGGNLGWLERGTITPLVCAAAFGLALVFVETRVAKEPLAPADVVLDRALTGPYFCNFFAFGADACFLFCVPLYYQAVAGKSATQVGYALVPSELAPIVGSLGCGVLIQRTGRFYWPTVSAVGIQLIGIILAFVSAVFAQSAVGIAIGYAVASFGTGIGASSLIVALVANAGSDNQAIATAVSYLFRSLGAVLGVSIGGTVIQHTLRDALHRRLDGLPVDADDMVAHVRASLAYIDDLEPALQHIVRTSYKEALSTALAYAIASSFCAVLCSFLVKDRDLHEKVDDTRPEPN
ncbi:MFS general substrate transporter [Artomyces pyxidatus]|uniref:MFS general substrate transporter n=1 Tax=Artomyces pyxidatus TaxID=48021 RepID=A0ACB8SXK7_9AGAM|nr:MFS general substrate transporter [Artomyces pyxidatus]